MQPALIAVGAFAASATHVLTGPDHMAAVLPLAVQHRARATAVGAWWGVGHGLGVVALGALAHLVLGRAALESLSGVCEAIVGVLLVAVGVRAIRWGMRAVGPAHDHHAHAHRYGAFGFGMLHGAAGGGHVFGVLPSLALSGAGAALYLGVYLVGAVLAMSAFAFAAGGLVPARAVPRMMYGSGVVAVAVGLFWIGAALTAA